MDPRARRALAMQFESLGGTGHGSEFAGFLQRLGGEPAGLLAWADLATELLIGALKSRFDGVGAPENTIVFTPDHSDEWWTKDKRYWMAMRSLLKTDGASLEVATPRLCERLQSLSRKLIEDLEAGQKIFVFKTMLQDPPEAEILRLHEAIRSYGDPVLLYIRHADDDHPAGSVAVIAPGLLVGYVAAFEFSADKRPLGSSDRSWLAVCDQAIRLVRPGSIQGLPEAASDAQPETTREAAKDDPRKVVSEDAAGAADATQTKNVVTAEPPAPRANVAVETQAATPSVPPRRATTRAGRRIVLIGNCQMQSMASLYKRFVVGRTHDVVEHVPSYQDLTDANRASIENADLVVEQLFDLKQQADIDAVPTTTPRIFIPMVTAAFLWPFAGSPHPKNTGHVFLPSGPYGGEASDSYLNRLIVSGVDPEEAVETYAKLDVNSRVNLDRLFEIVIDRQRARDEAAGYGIAEIIEQHFRSEQIFLTPYHPNVRVATALATRFFEELGAERGEIELMRECTWITPFPKSELPFHPSVCRHFGLDFVTPDRRYRFMNEGLFTFREYALRYMRYEWNDAIEEGMYLSQNARPAEALERLKVSVQRSPDSAAAYNALSHVLAQQGARHEALAAMYKAIELEPETASYHANLGNLLRQERRLDEALAEFRAAASADPAEPHYRLLLAHLLRQFDGAGEACDVIREAIRLDPYAPGLRSELAGCLEAKGDLAGAVAALQEAVAADPDSETLYHQLAALLGRLNRIEEAVEAAKAAVAIAPDSTRSRIVLSDLLLRQGDKTVALNEAYVAAVTKPDSAHAYGHLGHVLHLTGDVPAAEAAFRRAARLDPRNAHYQHEISVVLHRQQRYAESIEAAREATQLQPNNPHRFVHLASLLGQRGDLLAAQGAQRGAVELEPEAVGFRVALSDLYARAGQLEQALVEAEIAAEYHPNSVPALEHLAHIATIGGDVDRAEAALRKALQIEPGNEKLLRRLESLHSRLEQVVAV